MAAFGLLRWWTRLDRVDRGAMAVHYGSTALVTFTAALMRLGASDVPYEGYVATLLTVLEVPGIVVGLSLAKGRSGRASVTPGARWSSVVPCCCSSWGWR